MNPSIRCVTLLRAVHRVPQQRERLLRPHLWSRTPVARSSSGSLRSYLAIAGHSRSQHLPDDGALTTLGTVRLPISVH